MYKYTWKLKIRGRELTLNQCVDVALSFLRTCVDGPEILTGWDGKGGKPLAQEFFLAVSLTVT